MRKAKHARIGPHIVPATSLPKLAAYATIRRHGGKPMTILRVTRREFGAALGGAAAWPVVGRCPSSNGLGQSELFRDGGSGSFGFEIRRLSTDVSIVAV